MSMESALARKERTLHGFEDFYKVEFERVYRAVYLTTGDREGALDASQEAFKRAYVRWRRLSRKRWAGGWVMTTALNAYRETRGRRRESVTAEAALTATSGPGPERLDVVDGMRRLPRASVKRWCFTTWATCRSPLSPTSWVSPKAR
jgi:DNA-directed RNA polymerase specialized sigma24 family protein